MPQNIRKTRKSRKTRKQNNQSKYVKYHMKTCRAHKYKSVYGGNGDGIRSNRQLFY